MVNAIDNSDMLDYRGDQGTAGFAPVVSYVFNAGSEIVSITNATTWPSGKSLGKVKVSVHDKFGNQQNGVIDPDEGSGTDNTIVIDVSDLDLSKPLDITATVLDSTGRLVADGGAYNINAAGNLSSWDKQYN